MFGEALLLHIVESSLFHFFRHGYLHIRLIKCRLFHPNQDIRIAFSAMLLIRQGGKYLLVRNLHRPESFGPLGGVYKYTDSTFLDELEFKPQVFDSDMANDLRGFLPRKRLAKLVVWFKQAKDRESASDCLKRELAEEVREAGLKKIKDPDNVPVRLVRSVHEGPEKIPGQAYTQYRIFEIYELDSPKGRLKDLQERLVDEATQGHKNLVLAHAEEIISGRDASGHLIGHHAGYFLGEKRIRPESPMFATTAANT